MNKKQIFPILLALSAIMLSCRETGSDIEQLLSNIDSYSVKIDNQNQWSIISTNGDILVADAFVSAPTVAIDGIFSVYDSVGISFKHLLTAGSYKQIDGLKGLRYAGAPYQGVIPVTRPNSPIEIVDTTGNRMFTLNDIEGHNFSASGPFFSDKLLIVREQGSQKWGAVNTDGHLVINPEYLTISVFNCGHALATTSPTQTVILKNNGDKKSLPEGWVPLSGNFVYNHALLINTRSGSRCVTDTKGNITEFTSSQVPVAIGKSGVICMDNTGAYILYDFSGKQLPLTGWSVAAPVTSSTLLIGSENDKWFIADNKLTTLYEAPDSCSITPLLGNKAYFISGRNKPAFLISDKYSRIENLPVSRLEQKLYMNDILLSDREEDHREFNTADPGDDIPGWMEPDTLTTE